MSTGMFLAVFGGPFLLVTGAWAWLVFDLSLVRDRGLLALGVGLGGWAVLTVTMSLLSYNLIR